MNEEEEPDLDFIEWKKRTLGEFENHSDRAQSETDESRENTNGSRIVDDGGQDGNATLSEKDVSPNIKTEKRTNTALTERTTNRSS